MHDCTALHYYLGALNRLNYLINRIRIVCFEQLRFTCPVFKPSISVLGPRGSEYYEKERAIKLESHSRRNNLNVFNIPEKKDESFENSETILPNFMVEGAQNKQRRRR